jgi:hypothetical protein
VQRRNERSWTFYRGLFRALYAPSLPPPEIKDGSKMRPVMPPDRFPMDSLRNAGMVIRLDERS